MTNNKEEKCLCGIQHGLYRGKCAHCGLEPYFEKHDCPTIKPQEKKPQEWIFYDKLYSMIHKECKCLSGDIDECSWDEIKELIKSELTRQREEILSYIKAQNDMQVKDEF